MRKTKYTKRSIKDASCACEQELSWKSSIRSHFFRWNRDNRHTEWELNECDLQSHLSLRLALLRRCISLLLEEVGRIPKFCSVIIDFANFFSSSFIRWGWRGSEEGTCELPSCTALGSIRGVTLICGVECSTTFWRGLNFISSSITSSTVVNGLLLSGKES